MKRGRKIKDLTGEKFGRLTALYDSGKRLQPSGSVMWICLCECSKIIQIPSNRLVSGRRQSCGCIKKERYIAVCSECKELKKYHAKGLCKYCYWKKYYLEHKKNWKQHKTNDKSNINDHEGQFAEHLESQGKSWAYQPIKFELKNTTYKPDFYCPDNNTFYEIAGTRQAIHQRKRKVKELMEMFPNINIKIVKPNGNKYKFYKEGLE